MPVKKKAKTKVAAKKSPAKKKAVKKKAVKKKSAARKPAKVGVKNPNQGTTSWGSTTVVAYDMNGTTNPPPPPFGWKK